MSHESKFKVGDKVTAVNGAWSKILGRNSNCRVSGGIEREFMVVGVNCMIPIKANAYANTLIWDADTLQFIAINDCNLHSIQNIGIAFFVDGRNVTKELSDKSKKAILEAQMMAL